MGVPQAGMNKVPDTTLTKFHLADVRDRAVKSWNIRDRRIYDSPERGKENDSGLQLPWSLACFTNEASQRLQISTYLHLGRPGVQIPYSLIAAERHKPSKAGPKRVLTFIV